MLLETVIGLEIHAELKTNTKIFCSCSTEFGAKPNENTCPVCLGIPGTLPVLNEEVVNLAIKAGKAVNCKINNYNKMDRKNYFYPDLTKNYQTSQYDLPMCVDGMVNFTYEGKEVSVRINRIHIEEDAGKLVHLEDEPVSLIDYNRAGVPLVEIVTEPDLRSPEEAAEFMRQLKGILEYADISDCRMEQGSIRCDANISLRPYGSEEYGTRENITYEDLPQVLVDAVVAAEDSRFFEHNGFDLPRIAKAAMSNLVAGGIRGGGSTITQQLIKKTYFPNAEKTYTRKFSEIILAIQADKALSKEEILTLYLNKIYFGRSTRSIGISSASRYYFDKDVSELTLPEAAMLAGSLNSPYNYDPYYCLNNATKRRNTILNLMVKHGYITQKECDDAKNVKVENMLCSSKITNSSVNAAYVDIVTDEVKKRTGLDPLKTQMNIYTYCNSETQALAAAFGNGEKYDYSDEDMRMGGAVQSCHDCRIIAGIGGRNYSYGDFNYATRKLQPGSSVKPFLDYGLAFENLDWSTGHSINDDDYYNGKFKNWDRQFHGLVTVENALENSWNIPAIKTFDEVEFDDFIGLFITGGRSPEYIRMDHKVISLVKCFVRSGKPVAAICHAAQVLTAADVVCGRKLTCYPALAAEVKLAGGNYIEVAPDEAVVDCNLITSPAWPGNTAILREFAKALGCEFIFRP